MYRGVTHFCVPNFTADLGRSSSVAIAQAMLPYLLSIARHGARGRHRKVPRTGARRLPAARETSMTSDYRSRIMTPDQALAVVRSGQRVYVHNGCAEPVELVKALTRRGPELRDVEVLHMATMGIADYSLPEYEGHFRHNALFIGGNVRKAVQEGRADYTPIFLSEIEGLFTSGALPIDVCLLQCTPPDNYGYMSLGVEHRRVADGGAVRAARDRRDQRPDAAHARRHVPARQPRGRVRRDVASALGISASIRVSDVHRAIARHVAPLIPDGATIQTGIGGIPEAVLGLLRDHKDLGIHSEMVPDSAVELIQAGVINGERKTLHPRKVVAGFVLGQQAAVRFHRQQSELRVPPHGVRQRSVRDRAERPHGGAQLGDRGGPHRAGVRRFDGADAVQRHRRAGGFPARRGAVEGRHADHHAALDGEGRRGLADRAPAAAGRGRGDLARRRPLRDHGTRRRVPARQDLRQRAEALIRIADPQFREELEAVATRPG